MDTATLHKLHADIKAAAPKSETAFALAVKRNLHGVDLIELIEMWQAALSSEKIPSNRTGGNPLLLGMAMATTTAANEQVAEMDTNGLLALAHIAADSSTAAQAHLEAGVPPWATSLHFLAGAAVERIEDILGKQDPDFLDEQAARLDGRWDRYIAWLFAKFAALG